MPDKISREYERKRYIYISQINQLIEEEFNSYSISIVNYAYSVLPDGTVSFKLSDYPQIKAYIDTILIKIKKDIQIRVVAALNNGWQMAEEKNLSIIKVLDKSFVFKDITKEFDTFEKKVNEGLSEQIYRSINQPYKQQFEESMTESLQNGESRIIASQKLIRYLKDPSGLNTKPGKGTYSSATKNIQRLTRQVINTSFRLADQKRWQTTPIILGYTVKLSGSHRVCDMCDSLVGDYPKEFEFSGWHVQCLCYIVPILMTTEQFKKYNALVLLDADTDQNISDIVTQVEDIPDKASKWIDDNIDRLEKLKTRPYWLANNKQLI